MYAVVWSDEAFDAMAAVVRENPSRTAELAWALQELAAELSQNPADAGESRWGDFRVIFPRPLAVYFRVDEDVRRVEVAQVRLVG